MSRFWAGDSSSGSDSSSDSDSSDYSSEEEDRNKAGGNRWVDMSDSSDSDDEVRVVKSAKERALELFQKHISAIRNAMKVRDYYEIQCQFDELSKAMIKNKKTLAEGVPRPLIRILVELEDYVPERLADKAAFKKLSARQGRALNRMKLTLKKHNKPFEMLMEEYRKNPVEDDDEDDDGDDGSDSDSSDSDDSSSSSSSSSGGSDKKKKGGDDSDSDSDSGSDDDDDSNDDDSDVNWESDSESSSSSDDDEGLGELKGRARWLKKTTVVTKKEKKKQEHKPKEDGAAKKVSTVTSRDHEAIRAPKSVIPEEGLTAAILQRKVKEIVALRGRRGTDNRVILRQLEGLSRLSMQFGPRVEVPVLMYVISAQFGMQRTMDDYMEPSAWRSCASYLQRISEYIVDQDYRLGVETIDEADMILGKANKMKAAATGSGEGAMAAVAAEQKLVNPHTGEVETEDQRAERIRLENESKMTAEELKTIPVVGSLTLHMSMLEEEYTKSLQHISQHSEEYIARLRDESKLVHLLSKIQSYLEREGANEDAAKLAQLRVEHIYYRHDSIATMVEKASEFFEKYGEVSMLHPACVSNQPGGTDFTVSHPAAVSGTPSIPDSESAVANADWTEVMNKLCTFVYKHGSEQAKARATICQVYHHALHDRFLEARDLLLMSHIQENIYNIGDVTTMILFNRMMAILGMCAFRLGRLHEAHNCLGEVCSGRVRELLAQGVSMGRFSDKTPEQEKAEKRRQVPYHQHINLDLLEACHLISAMLLEIPNMAAASVGGDAFSGRRSRTISRTFRKYFDMYDHQVFTGPPEQTRDFVMKASKALALGDWKTCASMVTGLEVWNLVPGDNAIEQIKTMLTEKIKLEGLRTYLFAFSAQYDSLSLSQLCGMFEMSKNEVHSVVSKMMINRELFASWDQVTSTIVLRKVEPNSLQVMALQFAEKAANLVEANERLLDSQTGNGFRDDWHHKGGGDNDYNRNRGGRDGGHRGQGGRGGGRGGRGRGQGRGGGRGGRGRGQGGRGGRGRGQGTNNRPRR